MRYTLQLVVGFLGSTLTYLLGGWDALLIVLIAFVVIDYLSGVLAAAHNGKLNSAVGFRSIPKKVMIFLLVAIANLAEYTLAPGSTAIRNGVICFYLANEALSILENAGEMGLPIPTILRRAIELFKNKTPFSDEEQDA